MLTNKMQNALTLLIRHAGLLDKKAFDVIDGKKWETKNEMQKIKILEFFESLGILLEPDVNGQYIYRDPTTNKSVFLTFVDMPESTLSNDCQIVGHIYANGIGMDLTGSLSSWIENFSEQIEKLLQTDSIEESEDQGNVHKILASFKQTIMLLKKQNKLY